MRQSIFVFVLFLLFSCSETKKTESASSEAESTTVQSAGEKSDAQFVKYATVAEMFEESGDFTEGDGSLKIISNNPVHVQVSKPMTEVDLEKFIIEQTRRDIVYVVFQTFAQTNLNEITVTSVPMLEKENYVDKYKLKATVTREKAKSILNKYLQTENFETLYTANGSLWLPNEAFDKLKYGENMSKVFADLK